MSLSENVLRKTGTYLYTVSTVSLSTDVCLTFCGTSGTEKITGVQVCQEKRVGGWYNWLGGGRGKAFCGSTHTLYAIYYSSEYEYIYVYTNPNRAHTNEKGV